MKPTIPRKIPEGGRKSRNIWADSSIPFDTRLEEFLKMSDKKTMEKVMSDMDVIEMKARMRDEFSRKTETVTFSNGNNITVFKGMKAFAEGVIDRLNKAPTI